MRNCQTLEVGQPVSLERVCVEACLPLRFIDGCRGARVSIKSDTAGGVANLIQKLLGENSRRSNSQSIAPHGNRAIKNLAVRDSAAAMVARGLRIGNCDRSLLVAQRGTLPGESIAGSWGDRAAPGSESAHQRSPDLLASAVAEGLVLFNCKGTSVRTIHPRGSPVN